jgi:hypothetical protein
MDEPRRFALAMDMLHGERRTQEGMDEVYEALSCPSLRLGELLLRRLLRQPAAPPAGRRAKGV